MAKIILENLKTVGDACDRLTAWLSDTYGEGYAVKAADFEKMEDGRWLVTLTDPHKVQCGHAPRYDMTGIEYEE